MRYASRVILANGRVRAHHPFLVNRSAAGRAELPPGLSRLAFRRVSSSRGSQAVGFDSSPTPSALSSNNHEGARAQLTAEWLNTTTGKISRKRIAPADRAAVRRFAAQFCDEELEVTLEATTRWRFVVEELRAIGAQVHLAEPAETAISGATRTADMRCSRFRVAARQRRQGRCPGAAAASAYFTVWPRGACGRLRALALARAGSFAREPVSFCWL